MVNVWQLELQNDVCMGNAGSVRAASIGGSARVQRYRNPGTVEGRRLGGLHSLATHRANRTAFKTLRTTRLPKPSAALAELLGILASDGHMSRYQVSVTTHSVTDIGHARYVQKLLIKLFGMPVSLTKRKSSSAVVVLLSSKFVCDFLERMGMSRGNKVHVQIAPPTWVLKKGECGRAYLLGLIDTDGCVYADRHRVNGKSYCSVCIAFTNASVPLLSFVERVWRQEGFSPTASGRDVRLRRRRDVLGYAQTIGFSNPKHVLRIEV